MSGEERTQGAATRDSGVRSLMLMDVRVLSPDDLPGSMAMTRDEDGTILYISERARAHWGAMTIAHDAAHLLMGVETCDDKCDYLTGTILRMLP